MNKLPYNTTTQPQYCSDTNHACHNYCALEREEPPAETHFLGEVVQVQAAVAQRLDVGVAQVLDGALQKADLWVACVFMSVQEE